MADKIVLFLGIWLAASVLTGVAMGRMMQVGGATQERARVMRQTRRNASHVQRTSRRAA